MMIFLSVYTLTFAGMLVFSLITKVLMKLRGTYDRTPKAVQIEELVMAPVMLVGLIGSALYLFDVPLVGQTFWKIFAALFIVLSVVGYWMPKFQWIKQELDPRKFAIVFSILNLLNLPFVYMLINYAYVSYPI